MSDAFYLGVDVGTGSVRTALVSQNGTIVSVATKDIKIWNPKANFYQQSSDDIWLSVLFTIEKVLNDSGIDKNLVHGLGFDGTCSMVVLDEDGEPVTVCPEGNKECNIVMWMDHRAEKQVEIINATNHEILKNQGGQMSVEMQPPKLMWLKENLFESCWMKAHHFFDLPDFLTWKATGSLSRSLCSLVCKWSYQANNLGESGWNSDFLASIGLEDLLKDNCSKIGVDVQSPGTPCGTGLSASVAKQMGLKPNIPVGTSILDAYAGVLGCLGCSPERSDLQLPDITSRLVLICGTSSCHMILSEKAVFVPGVWGPYFSTILPGLWNSEGGQSATGKLVDLIIESHPAYKEAMFNANQRQIHIQQYLNEYLTNEAEHKNLPSISHLTADYHVWPDFHGNRSPIADPQLKGMKCGMTLAVDIYDLALQYLATIQALAYGTLHIIEEMVKSGHSIECVYICGGLRKNPVFVKTHADVSNLPLILPDQKESVLLGAAVLGASASGCFASVQDTMNFMGGTGKMVLPSKEDSGFHQKKYKVFQKMVEHQMEYRSIMKS